MKLPRRHVSYGLQDWRDGSRTEDFRDTSSLSDGLEIASGRIDAFERNAVLGITGWDD